MAMIYSRKAVFFSALCFSRLPDYGSSEARLSGTRAAALSKEGANAQPLALIRHLRVIRLNTAFTLHSAHSSRPAPLQEMHCTHTRSKTLSRPRLILQAPVESCVRV